MVRQVKIWHSCWKSQTPCPPGKRGGRPSSMLSVFSSNARISDGMGVHKCIQYGQLACFGRHYECWKVYQDFRATYAPRQRVFQQDNAKRHTAAITTAWLRSRRVQVLNWPACSSDLSLIENVWCIIKQKICQRRPRTLQPLETYISQEWDKIPWPKLQKLIISMPRCLKTVLEMLHHANMPLPQLFWDF